MNSEKDTFAEDPQIKSKFMLMQNKKLSSTF